jgi:serine/threonine protein kinase
VNPVIVRLFTQKKPPADDAAATVVAPPPPQPIRAPRDTRFSGQVGRWRLGKLRSEHDGVAVFEAWADEMHGPRAPYVVKLARRAAPPSARESLAREAAAARDVHNSHIVSILAAQLHDSPHYVVMPRLFGKTLETLLDAGAPLPLATALWFARQTAQGLAALHGRGWLHGDVKPANLLISPGGHLTLIDLGCTRRLDERGEEGTPYLAGTLEYLAPEAFVSRLRVDARSDLFSLGVVLFQMLTGRLPFASVTPAATIEARLSAAVPDVREFNVGVPWEVEQLTKQLLAREPLRRPSSAGDVAQTLADLEIAFLTDR